MTFFIFVFFLFFLAILRELAEDGTLKEGQNPHTPRRDSSEKAHERGEISPKHGGSNPSDSSEKAYEMDEISPKHGGSSSTSNLERERERALRFRCSKLTGN